MSTAASRRAAAFETAVLAALDAIRAEQRELRRLLEERRGVREAEDVELFIRLLGATEGRPFTAAALLRDAPAIDPLQAALTAADITDAATFGQWLARMVDIPVSGFALARGPRGPEGRRWSMHAL